MARNIVFAGDTLTKQPQELYKKFLSTLAEKIDTDITMCVCHGKYDAVPSEIDFDKMYIYVQLLPREFTGVKKSTVSEITIGKETIKYPVKTDSPQPCPQGDSVAFDAAPEKAVIIKDHNNQPIAAVYEGGIYIMNDCIHARCSDEGKIALKVFSYIVERAVEEGTIMKYLKSGLEEKSKRCLESALKVQFTQRLEKEHIQLKAAKDTIAQYEKGIVEGVRKVMSAEKIVEAIQNNIADIPKALDKTWSELMRMKNGIHYSSISFNTNGIKAITKPVTLEYNKVEYAMGRYEVTLKFNGECSIVALDFKHGSYDHPHISSGRVCWGNFAGYIPKLIGSSEFDVALVQIHTFLCHYDSASPYSKIENWPKKDTKSKSTETKEMEVRF